MVARILKETREQTLEEFSSEQGDGPWSFGCRVHERSCKRIQMASVQYPWLTVEDPSLHFVFAIEGVPFRFFRGDADSPKKHLLQRSLVEIQQHQAAFSFLDGETEGWFWRIAVEVDVEGRVAEVVVFEVRASGDCRNRWSVPLEDRVSILTKVGTLPNAVQLDPAEVGIREAHESVGEAVDGPAAGC